MKTLMLIILLTIPETLTPASFDLSSPDLELGGEAYVEARALESMRRVITEYYNGEIRF